jgi:O-antigen ligase
MTRLWAYGVSAWFLFVPIAIALGQAAPALRVVMQLAGVIVLVVALFKLRPLQELPIPWWAIALGAAAFAFPLLQLTPLPHALWSELPGRQFLTTSFDTAGVNPSRMPITLSSAATLNSFLAMIPAFALFLATLTLSAGDRRKLVVVLLGLGLCSVVLGLAQNSQGPESSFYFLKDSNFGTAVGFFANRNHFAALLFCCMPFVSAWTIWLVRSGTINGFAAALGSIFIYGILILGLAVAGSRAGIILAMLAMLSAVFLAWGRSSSKASSVASKTVILAGIIGMMVIVEFGLIGIMRFIEQDAIDQKRLEIAGTSLRIASDMAPMGSGLGTFVPIYEMYETPQTLSAGLVNYAHNDWLQLWLEGGVGAAVLFGLFSLWYLARTFHVWRWGGNSLDDLMPRAATLVVALLLLHSFVDYPLRSTALMCVFALACGLMATNSVGRSARRYMPSANWRTS